MSPSRMYLMLVFALLSGCGDPGSVGVDADPANEGVPGRASRTPGTVSGLAEALLHMGPYEVGHRSELLVDPLAIAPPVFLHVFYPTDVDPADYPVAVYPQVIIPEVFSLPFPIDAEDYAPFVEGRVVCEDCPIAAGRHPAVVLLPGSGAPGFLHIPEGGKMASHGFVTAVATLGPSPDFCAADRSANLILDELFSFNETPENFWHQAMDPDGFFWAGFALGGRTAIARQSQETECGLAPETRIRGMSLREATNDPGILSLTQRERTSTPTFLCSQWCRDTQIDLQQTLGSDPVMLALEGIDDSPSLRNHRLFAQACMHYLANQLAGNPIDDFVPPFVTVDCNVADYVALEQFVFKWITRSSIAFFYSVLGEREFRQVLAPGHHREPGVHLIQTALGAGGDEEAEGFCSQPGSIPGETPIIQYSVP